MGAMQREGGSQKKTFERYLKYAAFVFAVVQAFGQCVFIKSFVANYDATWLAVSVAELASGALAITFIADEITKLKVGNGVSLLIFANIASSASSTVGQIISKGATGDKSLDTLVFSAAFLITCSGIVFVQEAKRKIPINYAQRS